MIRKQIYLVCVAGLAAKSFKKETHWQTLPFEGVAFRFSEVLPKRDEHPSSSHQLVVSIPSENLTHWATVGEIYIPHQYIIPKNHGISKLVVWRSQTPAKKHIQTPLFGRVQ